MSDSHEAPGGVEPTPLPGMAQVAQETPAESVAAERDAVGDHPDVGGIVPPDQSQ